MHKSDEVTNSSHVSLSIRLRILAVAFSADENTEALKV